MIKKRGPGLFAWPGYILFFVMLFLPVSYNEIKGLLIGIVEAIVVLEIILHQGRVRLHKTILLWTLFYVTIGIAYILLGSINDTPGALFSSLVYVIYPLVYILFVAGAADYRILVKLFQTMVIATIAIGLAAIYYVLSALGWLPKALSFDLDYGQAVGLYQGFTQMQLFGLSSLVFLVPFLIAALIVNTNGFRLFGHRIWLWLALLLGSVVVLLSGRRALQLVVAFAPVLLAFFWSRLPARIKLEGRWHLFRTVLGIIFVVLVVGVCLSAVIDWNWQEVGGFLLRGFDVQQASGGDVRLGQFSALLNAWMDHPLFGAGLGAYVPEYVRSVRPWEYELQYVLLLFQTGMIGVLLYSSGIVWVYWMGLKMIRSGSPFGVYMVPVLVGTSSFLIANAVDPYLQTFGYLWTIFLPVALINSWLLTEAKPLSEQRHLGK